MLIRGNLSAIPAFVLMVAVLAAGGFAQEKSEKPKEEKDGPVKHSIHIRGILAPALPADVKKMVETAKELQELQQQYKKTIESLIKAAKNLENTDNLMAEVPKIAKLAKAADELREKLEKKQKEMNEMRGGARVPRLRLRILPQGDE